MDTAIAAGPATGGMDTTITEVTVYPYLARVTRTGHTTVQPGDQDVAVTGLPAGVDPDSVRVVAHGPEGLVLTGVRMQLGPPLVDSRRIELQDRVDTLSDRLAELDDASARADADLEGVRQLRIHGAKDMARSLGDPDGPARVAQIEQTLGERQEAAYGRRRAAAVNRRAVERDLAAAREALEQAGTDGPASQEAVVGLRSEQAGDAQVAVTYLVSGASWEPLYDIRVAADGATVSVDYTASVSQSTGEDWPELALALSTARPGHTRELPDPQPWYVHLDHVGPVARAAVPAMAPAALMMDAAGQATPAYAKAAREVADVSDSGVAKLFRAARPLALPADGGPRQVALAHLDTAVRVDHVCAPRLSPEVHVRARLTNSGEATWLPGAAAVFYGDEFVGRTAVELVAPGEEVELHLGVQDAIRVERELVRRDARRAGLLGGGKTRLGYRSTVTSHLADPTGLTLIDQVPVAREPALEVRVDDVSPAATRTDEVGTVEWDVELAPGREYVFALAFTVEGPKDRRVYGL